jgi:hypothetical protein
MVRNKANFPQGKGRAKEAESAMVCQSPGKGVRLISVGDPLAFVMLSDAKHLAGEEDQRLFSCSAQILR